MMTQKEMIVPITSIGADAEQPSEIFTGGIITENLANCNDKMLLQRDHSYLKTISMRELFDSVYAGKPPVIDGLLYPGTYLFAGAPKLGKSFLMAQIAYHVSTNIPLWDYPVRKGPVLYLALEDDYRRLQERFYRMFGTESTTNLYFSVSARQLGNGLDEQLIRFVEDHPETTLIIIDTLQKIREIGGDKYSYASDYEIITRLKKFPRGAGVPFSKGTLAGELSTDSGAIPFPTP